jgi:hypothetical protein
LLQRCVENARDFWFHLLDDALDFFFIVCVLRDECVLEFHNSLNDELELINIGFFFIGKDIVVFEDLGDDLVELHEGVRQVSFNLWDVHDV